MVFDFEGEPRTKNLPWSNSISASDASSRRAATPHPGGPPAAGRAATRVGPQPVGRVVGVALLDLDVGGRNAELLGHDLRKGRLVSLTLALDAQLEDRLAGGMH